MSMMRASFFGLSALAATLLSCVSAYRPPTPTEPHATVKVRRVYETTPGARLDESCSVDGHPALQESVATNLVGPPRSGAFLMHPKAAKVELRGAFSHQENRTVQESYTEQVPYTDTESYSCGTATSFRTCTRTVTRYRSDTKYRTVTKLVDVGDGNCSRELWLQPAAEHVYLIDFTYRDNGVCEAVCIEQVAIRSDGSFDSQPCPVPPVKPEP
jgi:hypothetical protein